MKIKTGEIVDKNKDKNVVSSVKLSKGTRVGTLKLTVNGEEQDSVPIRGLGGGSSTVVGGSVDTQALWDAINKKVDIDFFKNLFTVYDSSDIEIATNTYTRKPDNLKISVGTWTEEYLSALGKNSEGGGGGGVGTVIGIALGTGTTPIYPDDDTGIVTLPAYPTKVSQLANDSGFVTSSTLNNYVTSSYLANNFYTKAQADSKYMTIAAFESLFNALDSNGDKINHPYSSGVDSIKALVGLWTEEYLSALGQNSEGGSSGGGSVNAIKVGTNPDTYLDPVEGIIDMSNYVTTAAQRTLWTNSAHTHSNKAVLDNITAGQVAAWNNMAAIMEEDQDNIINKWNEVVDFLSTYTEADTLANLLSNKLDVEFFRKIFTVYDEDGNTIVPNTYTQVADNLKILVGAWTEEYLSALGKNSEEGGGGAGTVTSVKIASNPDVFIDPVDGIIDMSSYATTWNNKQDAISDLATIRSNASNGNTAYSWGNHANAGYAQASNTVSNVAYNTTGKKLTKTINGNTTDIVSASTLVTDGGGAKASTTITAGNGLTGGGDLSSNRTINVVSANAAITVNADNIKLNVINDYTTTTNNTIIPLAAARGKDLNDRLAVLESWFEVDADGNIKTKDMPNGTHRGFYTESFVSALGSNSSGGGSGADLGDVWDSLTNQTGTTPTETTKIAIAHIPDTASTYGYLKSSALNGYATQSWVNQQGFLTTHQSIYDLTLKAGGTAVTTFTPNSADASLDFVAGTNISLTRGTNQITIANTYSYTLPLAASGTRGGVQIGYSETNSGTSTTRNYAVKLSSEKMYVNVPWTDTTYKLTLNGTTNGASGGTSLGSFYAPTASGTANQVLISGGSNTAPSWTAQSNLSVGTAAKLGTGTTTYTAWGQTYWSSGVPQNVSGHLYMNNNNFIYWKDNPSSGTATNMSILEFSSANNLHVGYGSSGLGYPTYINGNVVYLRYGTSRTIGLTLSSAGVVSIPSTGTLKIGDCSITWDSTNNMLKFDKGIYSTGAVSALGSNSSGGGSGTFDEEAMWTALGTTSTAKVIASSHIPNLSWSKITSGKPTTLSGYGILDAYTKTQVDNALGGYLLLSGGTLIGTLTTPKIRINTKHNSGNTSGGIYYYDGTTDYLLIGQGSANLWIGANETDGTHHTGSTYISAGAGTVNVSRLVNGSRLNYMVLDTGNYSSYALPLSGGTLTGGLAVGGTLYTNGSAHMIKFDVDTSRALGYGWWDTNSNTVASIVYHNTAQNIILNPIGSASVYSDAVGKYSLIVGNNKLTYNTYTILHSNNTYVSSGKGYINGTEITTISGNAATASLLSYSHTNEINFKGGMQTNCYFNYRNADTNAEDGDTTTVNYKFCNYTRGTAYSTVTAGTFVGAFSGNATTATTLQTPRTIWGQSFNGSSDVSGSITGATTITASGRISASAFEGSFVNDGTVFYFGDSQHAIGSGTDAVLWAYGANSLLFYTNNLKRMTINSVGSVGIGTDSPSTRLHVSGSVFANGYETYRSGSTFYGLYKGNSITGSLTASDGCLYYPSLKIWMYATEVRVNGAIYGTGEITAASDARKKNIISNTKFNVKDIASARSILYEWNDGRDSGQVHGGSIAQDWLGKADSFLSQDKDGWYSINYGALALCSAITIAREVVKHEDEITRLKKVVVKQAKEIVDLKNKVREFEERRVA